MIKERRLPLIFLANRLCSVYALEAFKTVVLIQVHSEAPGDTGMT